MGGQAETGSDPNRLTVSCSDFTEVCVGIDVGQLVSECSWPSSGDSRPFSISGDITMELTGVGTEWVSGMAVVRPPRREERGPLACTCGVPVGSPGSPTLATFRGTARCQEAR
jgi:hypothetical protein